MVWAVELGQPATHRDRVPEELSHVERPKGRATWTLQSVPVALPIWGTWTQGLSHVDQMFHRIYC